jgi:Flp pilus assembly protein TadD
MLAAILAATLTGCRKDKPASVEELFTTRTLATQLLQRGQLAEAEVQLKKLIELAPDDPLGYANLGLTYLQQGRYPEAETQLLRARKLDPASSDVALMLAKLYALTGRPADARSTLEVLRRADPRPSRGGRRGWRSCSASCRRTSWCGWSWSTCSFVAAKPTVRCASSRR